MSRRAWGAVLLFVLALGGAPAGAEEVSGVVRSFDGRTLVVQPKGGEPRQLEVRPDVTVTFRDSGDRADFPDPRPSDVMPGMEVEVEAGGGPLAKITVFYVPEGMAAKRGQATAPKPVGETGRRLKARIEQIDVSRRQLRADVAGATRTFTLDRAVSARGFRAGDLVVLTLAPKDGLEVVTGLEDAALTGVVTRIDERRGSVTIEVDGRGDTYAIDREDLDELREGDRVSFEVEERGPRKVIVSIRRP